MIRKGNRLPLRLSQTQLDIGKEVSVLKSSEELGWPNLNVTLTTARSHQYEITHRALPLLWINMLFTALDASFVVDNQEEIRFIPAQGLSIIPPETPIGLRRGNDTYALHVFLKDEVVVEVAAELFDCDVSGDLGINPAFGFEDSSIAALLGVLKQALYEPAEHSALRIEYLSRALAADVLQKYAGHPTRRRSVDTETSGRLQASQVRLITEYIQQNLSSEILLNDLASLAGTGRTVFITRFKASFQQTPHQYIARARIRRGEELLAKSDLPISQIALACGFSGQPHFSMYFKRATGVTPLAYRQQSQ